MFLAYPDTNLKFGHDHFLPRRRIELIKLWLKPLLILAVEIVIKKTQFA
jgi:hypothetical protein